MGCVSWLAGNREAYPAGCKVRVEGVGGELSTLCSSYLLPKMEDRTDTIPLIQVYFFTVNIDLNWGILVTECYGVCINFHKHLEGTEYMIGKVYGPD